MEEWETISESGEYFQQILEKLKIPGGYLYRTTLIDETGDRSKDFPSRVAVAMVFVPVNELLA
jgi:hypothetical protein